MLPPTLVLGGLGLATIALHLRDPHQHGSWGICPVYAVTGLYCPGCGGLRAVNDLSNLQLWAAASSNLLFVALLPLLAYVFVRWSHGRWSDQPWRVDPATLGRITKGLMVCGVFFAILRNTPMGAWLAP